MLGAWVGVGCFGETAEDRVARGPDAGGSSGSSAAGGGASGGGGGSSGSSGSPSSDGGPSQPPPLDCLGRPLPGPGPSPDTASGYLVSGYGEDVPKQSGPVAALHAVGNRSCAVEASGAVWCWGFIAAEPQRAALVPTRVPEYDGVLVTHERCTDAGGACSVDVTDLDQASAGCRVVDGTLSCGGLPVPGVDRVETWSASDAYGCAIQAGRVWCWGVNDYGQLGTAGEELGPVQVAGVSDAVALALTRSQACVRTADGGVVCWGQWNPCPGIECSSADYSGSRPTRVAGLPYAVALAQTKGKVCIVPMDRRQVLCRQALEEGRFGVEHTAYSERVVDVPPAQQLVMGGTQICVRTTDSALCWGGNFYGAVGNGTWRDDVACPTEVLRWQP